MQIKLNKTFASDAKVDEYDVLQMKKALNRLGFYMPNSKTDITSIPDRAVFEALKAFQKDQGLQISGRAKPHDLTEAILNSVLGSAPDGYYIWRTVGDGKVRKAHARYNGQRRLWSDSPDPGEDFNCRCWAEVVKVLDSHQTAIEHSVSDCKLQEEVVAEIEKKLRQQKIHRFRLEIYYDILVVENNDIIVEMQTTLGMPLASLLITLPVKDLPFLGEVAVRSLGYFVGEEIIKKAQELGNSLSSVRKNIEDNKRMRKENQEEIEKLTKDLELVKEDLRECKMGIP